MRHECGKPIRVGPALQTMPAWFELLQLDKRLIQPASRPASQPAAGSCSSRIRVRTAAAARHRVGLGVQRWRACGRCEDDPTTQTASDLVSSAPGRPGACAENGPLQLSHAVAAVPDRIPGRSVSSWRDRHARFRSASWRSAENSAQGSWMKSLLRPGWARLGGLGRGIKGLQGLTLPARGIGLGRRLPGRVANFESGAPHAVPGLPT